MYRIIKIVNMSLLLLILTQKDVFAKRMFFVDLGPNPSLTLIGYGVISGAVWGVTHYLAEEVDMPIALSLIIGFIMIFARILCISCLVSIPINLLLN